MTQQSAATDRAVAITLRSGAFASFALLVIGLLLKLAERSAGEAITKAGVLLLLATPVLRIVVAGIAFLRERDRKYALISLVVLLIVVVSSVLGFEH